MNTRQKAGDNERKFKELFQAKAPETRLLGKKRYESQNVEISVDESFEHGGKQFLVEIDSANIAKLLVGQYVLLNQLRDSKQEYFFLVVHSHKNYHPMRTIHNLQLINEQLYGGNGMAFGAIHFDSLSKWNGGVSGLIELLNVPNSDASKPNDR